MIKLFSLKQQKKNEDGAGPSTQRRKASAAQLRITKDLNELQLPPTCNTIFPDPNDLLNFKLVICPDEGFYRHGKFTFNFKVGQGYPHEPPKVKCETMVYHPNIDLEGNVCLNILREDWKPVLTINSVIYGLQYLFLEPNPDDPLNKEAAEMLTKNRRISIVEHLLIQAKQCRGTSIFKKEPIHIWIPPVAEYKIEIMRGGSTKVKHEKTLSKSSILKYFTPDSKTNVEVKTFSCCNENQNSNICRKSKSNTKRQAVNSVTNEKSKKSKLLNLEPIVISSSDDGESESDMAAASSMSKVLTLNKNSVQLHHGNSHNLDHGSAQSIVPCDGETGRGNDKIQQSVCSGKHLSLPTKSLEFAKPIEAEITDLEQDSIETEEGGRVAYYHLNFCQVLDTVLSIDDDRALFEGSDDMTWINEFKSLPLPAQKLYVRLYHRKVAWLREEQIRYPDIAKNIKMVLERLTNSGFLLSLEKNSSADLNLDQVLKLLPSPDLKDLARSFKVSVTGLHKKDIRSELCKMCRQQRSLFHGFMLNKSRTTNRGLEGNVMRRALKALGSCYKVASDPRKAFNRVLLVFDVTRGIDDEMDCTLTGSKNALGQGRHLQLSAIVMAGMGKVCYPQFKLNRATSIFKRREDLLQYETAFQFQMDVLACVESGKWEDASLLCEKANKVKVEVLQRLKNYSKAVDILRELLDQQVYCQSRRGHWWERLALNVDQHLKDPVKSMNIIHESLTDSNVRVGHKLALAERANKILASKTVKKSPQISDLYKEKLGPVIEKLNIQHAPVVEITGCLLPAELQTGKSRFVNEVPDYGGRGDTSSTILCSVEELALSHYKSIGYPNGIHGEGGTFTTLFCLFMWDIIFMDGIPDVFRTSCQTSAIDAFTSTWDMEYGKACSGMDWERFSNLEEALGLIKCVGGKILAGIFRRLAQDLRHTRSGLPDLVVWNPTSTIYKLVEVKGPGDRLSTNQKLWIDELLSLKANVEVCKVIAVGGKKLSRD